VAATIADAGARVAYFARVDFAVNAAALALQLVATPLVAVRLGTAALLAAVPALLAVALPFAAAAPSLAATSALYVTHRAGGFALFRPGRELLATRFAPRERFQGKGFLDTVVYRVSDAAAAWFVAALTPFGATLPVVAVLAVAALWVALGVRTGRRFDAPIRTEPPPSPAAPDPPRAPGLGRPGAVRGGARGPESVDERVAAAR
jgi:ATP:ADP antiporter, AAA family